MIILKIIGIISLISCLLIGISKIYKVIRNISYDYNKFNFHKFFNNNSDDYREVVTEKIEFFKLLKELEVQSWFSMDYNCLFFRQFINNLQIQFTMDYKDIAKVDGKNFEEVSDIFIEKVCEMKVDNKYNLNVNVDSDLFLTLKRKLRDKKLKQLGI